MCACVLRDHAHITTLLHFSWNILMITSCLVPMHHKNGKVRKPYYLKKGPVYENHPEGRFSVFMYTKQVDLNDEILCRYSAVKFAGEVARFKTEDDAREFALYRLGLWHFSNWHKTPRHPPQTLLHYLCSWETSWPLLISAPPFRRTPNFWIQFAITMFQLQTSC